MSSIATSDKSSEYRGGEEAVTSKPRAATKDSNVRPCNGRVTTASGDVTIGASGEQRDRSHPLR